MTMENLWNEYETFLSDMVSGTDSMSIYNIKDEDDKDAIEIRLSRYENDIVGDDKIKFVVTAKGKTFLEAFDLAKDLWAVHLRRELPKGVKGLLGPKPRGAGKLKRVK